MTSSKEMIGNVETAGDKLEFLRMSYLLNYIVIISFLCPKEGLTLGVIL
jgi:hypothetical protein